jgi:hypothetical protein
MMESSISYLYGKTLPKPTNTANAKMLRRLCNSLALLKTTTARTSGHSCVLCGKPITSGDEYKNGGYARRAHLFCLRVTSEYLHEKGW